MNGKIRKLGFINEMNFFDGEKTIV